MESIELRCRCGKVRGTADFSRASRVRVVCHCGDCQTYARHLKRTGAHRPSPFFDASGALIAQPEVLTCK